MKYDTKKATEKAIKKMNCPGAWSPVFENSTWSIMNNITGKIIIEPARTKKQVWVDPMEWPEIGSMEEMEMTEEYAIN